MPVYVTTFKVEGSGEFPFDMLRYDQCFPVHEEDSHKIGQTQYSSEQEHREVCLRKWHDEKRYPQLTPDRWASMGWRIINTSGDSGDFFGTRKR